MKGLDTKTETVNDNMNAYNKAINGEYHRSDICIEVSTPRFSGT